QVWCRLLRSWLLSLLPRSLHRALSVPEITGRDMLFAAGLGVTEPTAGWVGFSSSAQRATAHRAMVLERHTAHDGDKDERRGTRSYYRNRDTRAVVHPAQARKDDRQPVPGQGRTSADRIAGAGRYADVS